MVLRASLANRCSPSSSACSLSRKATPCVSARSRRLSLPALERRLRKYTAPSLLILDEIGYLPCTCQGVIRAPSRATSRVVTHHGKARDMRVHIDDPDGLFAIVRSALCAPAVREQPEARAAPDQDPPMRIASWNVNSMRPRVEHLTSWLVRARPDIVCLQETTVEDDKFPASEIGDAGYRAGYFGQRTYNGVAILTRFGLTILFHDDVRAKLRDLMSLGLIDAFRAKHPELQEFSWWDYRMGAYKRNWGLRIDLALVTPTLMERVTDARIDRGPRELDRPSDHTPVIVDVD